MQPRGIRAARSPDELRAWYNAADVNGDGVISINEFFTWALHNTSSVHGGAALERAFKRYDKDNSGQLNFVEFEKAACKMGFGTAAHHIFASLDLDRSGTISYSELTNAFTKMPPDDPDVSRLCTAMILGASDERKALDTSRWVIRGRDVKSIRDELQTLLKASGAHVADLLDVFDQDHDAAQSIDDIEFLTAMKDRCGYRGSPAVLLEVFRTMDSDGNGSIGFVRELALSCSRTTYTLPLPLSPSNPPSPSLPLSRSRSVSLTVSDCLLQMSLAHATMRV